MSESTPAPTPPPSPEPTTPEKAGGFFQHAIDVYLAPREAFRSIVLQTPLVLRPLALAAFLWQLFFGVILFTLDILFAPGDAFSRIVRNPRFLVPLILLVTIAVGFYGIWIQNVDAEVFMEEQIKQSPFADRIPPEQMDEIVEQQAAGLTGWTGWLRPLLGSPIVVMVMAGLFWMIYRFFYGAEIRFKQAAAITVWSFLAYSLVTSPLTLSILALKGDWNINPETALQANPTLLLDQGETAPALWTFLGSLDLFSFWFMFLLATGFGIAIRKSTSSAIWGVAVLWALYVGVKVGFAALF